MGESVQSARPVADMLDVELVDLARLGASDAVAELWRRHIPAAVRLAAVLVGSSDAHDAATDAFLATTAALERGAGPGDGNFRRYLCTATRHRAIASLNRTPVPVPAVPDVAGPDLEESVMASAGALDSIPGWSSLPPRWRRALWLSVVEGRTPAELATVLSLSPNAAAALTYRARRALARWYRTSTEEHPPSARAKRERRGPRAPRPAPKDGGEGAGSPARPKVSSRRVGLAS